MHTLLHAEDDASVRAAVGMLLSRAGYEVVGVDSAEAAIALLGRRRFDVVLTDHRMASLLTGFAVVDAARRLEPRPWIIASSGDQDDTLRPCYAALGADRFLAKPYGAAEVFAALGDSASWRRAA